MERYIFVPTVKGNIDQQVPEFGNLNPKDLRYPAQRAEKQWAFGASADEALWNSSINRTLHFAYNVGELPYVHFPNAEYIQHFPFAKSDWQRYGNMESEEARMRLLLDRFPSRRFPLSFSTHLQTLLERSFMFYRWQALSKRLQPEAASIYSDTKQRMYQQKVQDPYNYHNGDEGTYQADPVFYKPSSRATPLETVLLRRGLHEVEIELERRDLRNVREFLDLYLRLKDPITPLTACLDNQAEIFIRLYQACQRMLVGKEDNPLKNRVLLTQLALEASFLALPEVRNVFLTAYNGHHELPYIDVDLPTLPRGEFANPKRVVEVLEEIVDDSKIHHRPVITPITVAHFQEPDSSEAKLFIVDGNNRATAILLMKYIYEQGFDPTKVFDKNNLRHAMSGLNLDITWERDLALALRELTPEDLARFTQERIIFGQFSKARVPALLVQEANFHTVAVALSQGSKIHLLQPMHQAIYNQEMFQMAIPSKQQTHGRAQGNDIKIEVI